MKLKFIFEMKITLLFALNFILQFSYCFVFRFVIASSEVGELNVVSTEYVETAELSKSLIVIISVIIVSLVLGNAAFVACFIFKRRSRRLKGNFVFILLYIVACLLIFFILILYIVVC